VRGDVFFSMRRRRAPRKVAAEKGPEFKLGSSTAPSGDVGSFFLADFEGSLGLEFRVRANGV
jgi:hypothetical protein